MSVEDVSNCVNIAYSLVVVDEGLSSKSIRRGGLFSSSNWPCFTLHKNAARNNDATVMLAVRRRNITLMFIVDDALKVDALWLMMDDAGQGGW